MEIIRDFIPKTYIPILFGSIILGVFGLIAFINLFLPNGPDILYQLQEIKSLKNPNSFLIADTLIIDNKEKSGDKIYSVLLYGRLKSNPEIKKTLYEGSLSAETSRSKYSRLHFMFKCTGCNHDPLYVCECLPILRSNIHPNIYANNPYTLDGEITQVILDLIMETYLFWIVPFLYIYWKLTQLLYHYLNRKIDEKKH